MFFNLCLFTFSIRAAAKLLVLSSSWRLEKKIPSCYWTEKTEDIWPLALELGSNNDEQELSPDKQNNVEKTCK